MVIIRPYICALFEDSLYSMYRYRWLCSRSQDKKNCYLFLLTQIPQHRINSIFLLTYAPLYQGHELQHKDEEWGSLPCHGTLKQVKYRGNYLEIFLIFVKKNLNFSKKNLMPIFQDVDLIIYSPKDNRWRWGHASGRQKRKEKEGYFKVIISPQFLLMCMSILIVFLKYSYVWLDYCWAIGIFVPRYNARAFVYIFICN